MDSHIHLGRSLRGEPVKIGAGAHLNLRTIPHDLRRYGAEVGCVVDLATKRGLSDLEELLLEGGLQEDEDGSFRAPDGTRIVGALEAEFRIGGRGPFHLLAYAGGLSMLRELGRVYREGVRNGDLSTQRMHLSPADFYDAVTGLGGALAIAHAFTPHRGLIGVGLTPEDVFPKTEGMGLEIGLSADVEITRSVGAIGELGLLGGSDAHGPDTIGREVNEVSSERTGYRLVQRMISDGADRIYGMHPAFGKYHRSFCPTCGTVIEGEPPQLRCPISDRHRVVVGVLDRARSLPGPKSRRRYPGYSYQLPLAILPGFGPRTRQRLVERFGSLHAAMHEAGVEEIGVAVGLQRATVIADMRRGTLPSDPGGGGRWGRVQG